MSLLTIVLSVLLPPVAVLLKKGLGGAFLRNVLFTILGWVPGVIHAFYVNSRWNEISLDLRIKRLNEKIL